MDDSEQLISERFDLVMEFRRGLSLETDRGCALMAAEYLSAQLAELLQAHFVDDAKACEAALEVANGPVSTFSSRIEFTYLLGFIGPVARRELHLIRKIRNEFATACLMPDAGLIPQARNAFEFRADRCETLCSALFYRKRSATERDLV